MLQSLSSLLALLEDPLELKEMKLQGLLYCFKLSGSVPDRLAERTRGALGVQALRAAHPGARRGPSASS